MHQAQRDFLRRPTRTRYLHVPVLNYQERAVYQQMLCPARREGDSKKPLLLATQQQIQDKYRKRGWRLQGDLVHPLNPRRAKVYVKDGAVAVVYPDASVSRHQKLQVTYERGWWSPDEKEKLREKMNAKMPVGMRRLLAPVDPKVLATNLLKALREVR